MGLDTLLSTSNGAVGARYRRLDSCVYENFAKITNPAMLMLLDMSEMSEHRATSAPHDAIVAIHG